ncbi:S1/P1 nuclease [Roseateles saccharophilus]|uniref:S1/P1 nuclease n=1 Tax=Roseateles saccharophilus TaxID=304 RepID=A0A4R3UWS9_ROSSA|nr:S1/P1 nuclease [Roseateles saccharophilus]MDG0833255.1 hypothetical protein [Roseateles saccharophilus]TCU94394.1 S1/P1 nuclease [Roseateles saccharophilus]
MRHLLAAAMIALPLAAQAWGPDGHQTVATIAAGLIQGTPAEARVAALLGDMTLQQASIWADCAKGISPAQGYAYPAPGKYPACAPLETPARIAEMADYVRRNDRQCHLGPDEASCHGQTHYTDIALQRSRYLPGFSGTRPDDVVGALRQAIQVLQGRPTTGQPDFNSPREALLVLVHLVGDIHQPLHVGAPYLDARGQRIDPDKTGLDPASFTVGGNSFPLAQTASAGPRNFHAYWDGVPAALRPQHVDAAWLAEARQVAANPGDPADWPARWASESLNQAGTAYEGLAFSARQDSHWSVNLPPGYDAKADTIKRQQLTQAGARLALVLKTVFAD